MRVCIAWDTFSFRCPNCSQMNLCREPSLELPATVRCSRCLKIFDDVEECDVDEDEDEEESSESSTAESSESSTEYSSESETSSSSTSDPDTSGRVGRNW